MFNFFRRRRPKTNPNWLIRCWPRRQYLRCNTEGVPKVVQVLVYSHSEYAFHAKYFDGSQLRFPAADIMRFNAMYPTFRQWYKAESIAEQMWEAKIKGSAHYPVGMM